MSLGNRRAPVLDPLQPFRPTCSCRMVRPRADLSLQRFKRTQADRDLQVPHQYSSLEQASENGITGFAWATTWLASAQGIEVFVRQDGGLAGREESCFVVVNIY